MLQLNELYYMKTKTYQEIPDDFSEVYNFYNNETPKKFKNYISKDLDISDDIKNGIYFMTYGGGPEGGYILTSSNKVYIVHRDWNINYQITSSNSKLKIISSLDGIIYVKLIN